MKPQNNKIEELKKEIERLRNMAEFVTNSEGYEQIDKVVRLAIKQGIKLAGEVVDEFIDENVSYWARKLDFGDSETDLPSNLKEELKQKLKEMGE